MFLINVLLSTAAFKYSCGKSDRYSFSKFLINAYKKRLLIFCTLDPLMWVAACVVTKVDEL